MPHNWGGLGVTLLPTHSPSSTLALSNPPSSRSWMPVVALCPALPPLFQAPMFPFVRPSGFGGRFFFFFFCEGVQCLLYSGQFCKVKACFSGVTLLTSWPLIDWINACRDQWCGAFFLTQLTLTYVRAWACFYSQWMRVLKSKNSPWPLLPITWARVVEVNPPPPSAWVEVFI